MTVSVDQKNALTFECIVSCPLVSVNDLLQKGSPEKTNLEVTIREEKTNQPNKKHKPPYFPPVTLITRFGFRVPASAGEAPQNFAAVSEVRPLLFRHPIRGKEPEPRSPAGEP